MSNLDFKILITLYDTTAYVLQLRLNVLHKCALKSRPFFDVRWTALTRFN